MPEENDAFRWFSENLWALWGIAGLGLAAAEMLTTDLSLLMMAGGALSGALVAAFLPQLVWLQVVVAVAVAVALLGLVRPSMLRRYKDVPGYRSALDKLVGSDGRATATITDAGGECRVNGEVWSARTLEPGQVLEPGTLVEVYEVDGATLVVYPLEPEPHWQREVGR